MVLEILVVCGTVAVVAGAKGADLHRRHLADRTLERYARVRGCAFAPASAVSGRPSPRVEGKLRDVPFTLDLCRIGARLTTRMSAPIARPPAPRLALVQRARLARALQLVDHGAIAGWDDPRLDHAYRVCGLPPDEARALFEPHHAILRVLDERSDVWFACDGGAASLTWSGVETDPAILDAARDLVVAAAGWHRAIAPYR